MSSTKNEPLHSSYIMSRMAVAAKEGGAIGIRANTVLGYYSNKKRSRFTYNRYNKNRL